MIEIAGASVCLLSGENVVAILRDNLQGLPYANYWDFPGGALEVDERPVDCGLREVYEETNLVVPESTIVWEQIYPFEKRQGAAQFIVAQLACLDFLKLGSEGQETRLMPISEFLARPDVVPAQKQRLQDYLQLRLAGNLSTLETIVPHQRESETLELRSA